MLNQKARLVRLLLGLVLLFLFTALLSWGKGAVPVSAAESNLAAGDFVRSTTTVQVKDYQNGTVIGQLPLGAGGTVPTTSLASALFNAQVSTIGQVQIGANLYYIVASDGHSLNPLLSDNSTWFWGSTAPNSTDYNTFVANNAPGLANGSIYLKAVLAAEIQFKDVDTGTVLKSQSLRNYDNTLYQPLHNFFSSILVNPSGQLSLADRIGEKKNYTLIAADGTATNPLLASGKWFSGCSLSNDATLLTLLANYGSQIKEGTVYLQVKLTQEEDNFHAPFAEKKLDFNQTYNWQVGASLSFGLGIKNDLAFCFDTTGSVGPFIREFAEALGGNSGDPGFVTYLREMGGIDNRYGVTNFGDCYYDGASNWFFKNAYLTSAGILGDGSGFYPGNTAEEVKLVQDDMRERKNTWGGPDGPEDSIYAAMRTIDEFKWRSDAKRTLVVFSDTSSKTRPMVNVGGYPVTLAGLQALAASKNIRLVWLGSNTIYAEATALTETTSGIGVETLTKIQTTVDYNYNSPIPYRAQRNDYAGFKKLLTDTVLLLTGDKTYKYTYHVDPPVYVSDGTPSSDIQSLTLTPSSSTVVTGTDTPSPTSDGPYFKLDNSQASHLTGQFNVQAKTVANPARRNDRTKVVIHYYRDGIENVGAKQTLYLGPYPDVNVRTSLRAVPNFDFGVQRITKNELFSLINAVVPAATNPLDLKLTNDSNPAVIGSIGSYLKTGNAATPVRRGVVVTDGLLDSNTRWQVETRLSNLQTNLGQAINDQSVKIRINHPLVQGITDLGQTATTSSYNLGCQPTVFSPEIINNGPAAIVANSFNPSLPSSNAVGSWLINFENANSAQLVFPRQLLNKIKSSSKTLIQGTLTWTLLSSTP